MQGQTGLDQAITQLTVATPGRSMVEVTARVQDWLSGAGADTGLLTIFMQHTSASLTIQENADPDVQADLLDSLDEIAPASAKYRHNSEGPDDMPAHIKSSLTSVSLSIPVVSSCATLGTWQGIYIVEHRSRPHSRNLMLNFIGTFRK